MGAGAIDLGVISALLSGHRRGRFRAASCGRRSVRNEFTAIVEKDGQWFIAYCPEIPGANGQGKTRAGALRNLAEAIALILEDRREDALRGLPADAERDVVAVG
jgi:predicted RNase H-like HicB family nuclease